MNQKVKKKKGTIGVVGATAIGVGGMMGAGLYTLIGLATASAGEWLPLAFIIGGVVAAFSVYSYSKLGVKYPNRGGAAQFLLECFGDGLIAGGMNVFQYVGWVIAMALYATGFSEYARQLFGLGDSPWVGRAIGVGIIVVMVGVNILGSKLVARAQTAIIAFELVILLAFIVLGLSQAHVPTISFPGNGGLLGILSAAGLLYVTYEGFGVVTNTAGSMANPAKQLPRAMYASLGIVMVVYVVASIVVVTTLGVAGAQGAQGHALADAGRVIFGNVGFVAIGVAALVATASAVNSTMFGDTNLAMRVSQVDEVPKRFGLMTRVGGSWGLLFTAALTCVFVVVFPLAAVGQMASLAFLLVYGMVSVGHVRVCGKTGAKRMLLVAAVVLNAALFVLLFSQTVTSGSVLTWASVVGLLVLSFALEWAWRKRTGQNRALLGADPSGDEPDAEGEGTAVGTAPR